MGENKLAIMNDVSVFSGGTHNIGQNSGCVSAGISLSPSLRLQLDEDAVSFGIMISDRFMNENIVPFMSELLTFSYKFSPITASSTKFAPELIVGAGITHQGSTFNGMTVLGGVRVLLPVASKNELNYFVGLQIYGTFLKDEMMEYYLATGLNF